MDFTKAIKDSMEPLARDISVLCRINSVEGEPKPGMPFGEGPAKALQEALKMGEAMGFKTENFDNYVGHIEYGEGEELIGILDMLTLFLLETAGKVIRGEASSRTEKFGAEELWMTKDLC